jgi:hypothetical protein
MNRTFREDRLVETAERLSQRITERFPQSGLAEVAVAVVEVTRESVVRAEKISRPNLWLRAGLVLIGLLAIAGLVTELWAEGGERAAKRLEDFLRNTQGAVVVLGGAALFLITLEVRLKRRRALQAVHELRGMAHIIDMHQLAKEPDRMGPSGAHGYPPFSADAMIRYLNFCTELLALVSKVGQLYVQDFFDAPSQAAVDQLENMVTALSGKIWQKIMILDRIRTASADPGACEPATAPAPEAAASGNSPG